MKVCIARDRRPKEQEETEKILGKTKEKRQRTKEKSKGESIRREEAINNKERRGKTMKIATEPKWHFSSGWELSGCGGLWKEQSVSHQTQ